MEEAYTKGSVTSYGNANALSPDYKRYISAPIINESVLSKTSTGELIINKPRFNYNNPNITLIKRTRSEYKYEPLITGLPAVKNPLPTNYREPIYIRKRKPRLQT
jgi:hypothetical protein